VDAALVSRPRRAPALTRALVSLAVLALVLVLAAGRARAQISPPSHTCSPLTLGDTVLQVVNGQLNYGFDLQNPEATVPGFQLHIDSSSEPPPKGSFVKFPDGWPIPGADKKNRLALARTEFQLTGTPDLGIRLRINNINAKSMKLGFSCHPDEFGGALKDGALRAEIEFSPDADEELQLQLTVHVVANFKIVKIDETFDVDLIDVDLHEPFTAIAAIVPKVSPDGRSIDLTGFVDVDEGINQLTFAELADELAGLELSVPPTVAAGICFSAPFPTDLCMGVVTPIVAATLVVALVQAKQDVAQVFRLAVEDAVAAQIALLNETAPKMADGNQWIRRFGDRLRGEIAKLELPQRIAALPVPEFDEVVPFTPPFVTAWCP
jgi:hypothetical protein